MRKPKVDRDEANRPITWNADGSYEQAATQADREANQRLFDLTEKEFAPIPPMPGVFRRSEPTWYDEYTKTGGLSTQDPPRPRTQMSYTQMHEFAKHGVFTLIGTFPDALRNAYNSLTEDEVQAFVDRATIALASKLSEVGL